MSSSSRDIGDTVLFFFFSQFFCTFLHAPVSSTGLPNAQGSGLATLRCCVSGRARWCGRRSVLSLPSCSCNDALGAPTSLAVAAAQPGALRPRVLVAMLRGGAPSRRPLSYHLRLLALLCFCAAGGTAAPPGVLLTWGVGGASRLGRPGDAATPTHIAVGAPPPSFVSVAAGGHTLAIDDAGRVWGWGRNSSSGGGGGGGTPVSDSGQLGHSVPGDKPGVVWLAPGDGGAGLKAVSVAAGRYHSLACAEDGTVYSWGLNDEGQLGRAATHEPYPVRFGEDKGIVNKNFQVFDPFSLFSLPQGPPLCTSGFSCRDGSAGPVPTPGGFFCVSVSAGRYGSAAVGRRGELIVWGRDACGGGVPESGGATAAPHEARRVVFNGTLPVPDDPYSSVRVTTISSGYTFWAAVDTGGRVWTCATGDDGYAGGLSKKSGGGMSGMSVGPRPRLPNADGELGIPPLGSSTVAAGVPVRVGDGEGDDSDDKAFPEMIGGPGSAAARAARAARMRRRRESGSGGGGGGGGGGGPGASFSAVRVVSIAAGRCHVLAATDAGDLWSWGCNGAAQLGRGVGGGSGSKLPGRVARIRGRVASVAAGEYFSLASIAASSSTSPLVESSDARWPPLAPSGGVLGWGSNGNGQLGRGPAAPRAGALAPAMASGALAAQAGGGAFAVACLSAGYQHAAAVVVAASPQPAAAAAAAAAGGGGRSLAAAAAAAAQRRGRSRGWGRARAELPPPPPPLPRPLPSSSSPARPPIAVLLPPTGPLNVPGPSHPTDAAACASASPQPHPARAASIEASSPDVFALLPPRRGGGNNASASSSSSASFLPGVASPCWREAGEGDKLRCLPAIHIIGVSKCGTTDLYKRLSRHPGFVPSSNKGPHFWDEAEVAAPNAPHASSPLPSPQHMTFSAYLDLFDALASKIESKAPGADALVSADGSSNTFTASGVWRRGHLPEGNVSVGELLRHVVPCTRAILMLRDPSERFFSAYHYYRRMYGGSAGMGPLSDSHAAFETYVTESIATWTKCVAGNTEAACVARFEPQQLIKGMYALFLWDWTPPAAPQGHLLVIRLEDYAEDTRRSLEGVFDFAGLPQPRATEWGHILGAPRANARPTAGGSGSGGGGGGGARRGALGEGGEGARKSDGMSDGARTLLRNFYAPFNERLAAALGDDRFLWAG